MSGSSSVSSSPIAMLALSAALGIILGMIEAKSSKERLILSPGALDTYVARVNHSPIRQLDYQRALSLLASGKRGELNDQDRELVLQRLIQEELLVQYASDTELLRTNQKLRAAVLQSVLAGLNIESLSTATATDSDISSGFEEYLTQLRNSADIQWIAIQ
ncbi:MAG: SurA N-terminal domain-containing protein [Porticoccaceae bacterium]|nr:SurA N-terminal domain-containing protein [Porticoccaceae bacterium]MDG1705145.1 SurA N-terminal domain-containing protein [Porticoccaceae bacterium]